MVRSSNVSYIFYNNMPIIKIKSLEGLEEPVNNV